MKRLLGLAAIAFSTAGCLDFDQFIAVDGGSGLDIGPRTAVDSSAPNDLAEKRPHDLSDHPFDLIAVSLDLSLQRDAGSPSDGSSDMASGGDMSGGDDLASADMATSDGGDGGIVCGAPMVADGGNPDLTIFSGCYASDGGQGVGECRNGIQLCTPGGDGGCGPCIGQVLPSVESCNNLDDDCDGVTDNGLGTITCGVGACSHTVPACVNGASGACLPLPVASDEKCGNGIDDNCDGQIDEGCNSIFVSQASGDDNNPGSANLPVKSIQQGILLARALKAGPSARSVLVAGPANCEIVNMGGTATYSEDVAMVDGISLYGGYSSFSKNGAWLRFASCVTAIVGINTGVVFDVTIVDPTTIDGFTITGPPAMLRAAITITSSRNVVVSDDIITGAGVSVSYGIAVASGANPLITRNQITGGSASGSNMGILSTDSSPTIEGNCDAFDKLGRCARLGCDPNAALFIHASGGGGGFSPTQTYGVYLDSSPHAVVGENSICAGGALSSSAGVLVVRGDASTVVRGNSIAAQGPATTAAGIWFDTCAANASPWAFSNFAITGSTGGNNAYGVLTTDCGPRIDSNLTISGAVGNPSPAITSAGIFCSSVNQPGSSLCTVVGNHTIVGASGVIPPNAIGVECDVGDCARIERNESIVGGSAMDSIGVSLLDTGTFVNANNIVAGCGASIARGINSFSSFARIQNNSITGGGVCANGMPNALVSSYAVYLALSTSAHGSNEVDLHSNDLLGGTVGTAITVSAAIGLTGTPKSGLGLVRNNIIDPGSGKVAFGIDSLSAGAAPRELDYNDVVPKKLGATSLYQPFMGATITTLPALNNRINDPTSTHNISSDPLFSPMAPLLSAQSPCIDAGTSAGAPATDYVSAPRPKGCGYDIGMIEYQF